MGLSLDWAREFATCDPTYYRHQQKLFLDFLAAGLVEPRKAGVNWDPVDGTVLANEQVIDGRGWRSGAPVEKKRLSQWFFRITRYAPELLSALDGLDRWPERVRLMQANWIGRSEGARLRFDLTAPEAGPEGTIARVEVYTTRPDTLFGMSFLAIAPEHPLAAAVAARDPGAAAFVADAAAGAPARSRSKPPRSSASTPACASNIPSSRAHVPGVDRQLRADGLRHRRDLRLSAHDQRDLEFARKYGLAVVPWCCRRAPIPRPSRSARSRTSVPAPPTTRTFWTGWTWTPPSAPPSTRWPPRARARA